MNNEVPDVLQQDRVYHMHNFTHALTQASHDVPHLDSVVDVLHHSFRTAVKETTTKLGLMSMDLRVGVEDDQGLMFSVRDQRAIIQHRNLQASCTFAHHADAPRPILRLYAQRAGVFSVIGRWYRSMIGKPVPSAMAILDYLVGLENQLESEPMVCAEQRRLAATIYQELLGHGYRPVTVDVPAEQRGGNTVPDCYQVKLSRGNIEVYFTYRPVGLLDLKLSPVANHYIEERQLAVG